MPYRKNGSILRVPTAAFSTNAHRRVATEDFCTRARNVVPGPPGVGKNHSAIALACFRRDGPSLTHTQTRHRTADRMARAMARRLLPRDSRTLPRTPNSSSSMRSRYSHLEHHASLLFQAICERYEKATAHSTDQQQNKSLRRLDQVPSPAMPSWLPPPWIACSIDPPSSNPGGPLSAQRTTVKPKNTSQEVITEN